MAMLRSPDDSPFFPKQGFFRYSGIGGVAERSKAAVLKTVERKLRGFESYPLRQFDRKTVQGEVAEWSKASAC